MRSHLGSATCASSRRGKARGHRLFLLPSEPPKQDSHQRRSVGAEARDSDDATGALRLQHSDSEASRSFRSRQSSGPEHRETFIGVQPVQSVSPTKPFRLVQMLANPCPGPTWRPVVSQHHHRHRQHDQAQVHTQAHHGPPAVNGTSSIQMKCPQAVYMFCSCSIATSASRSTTRGWRCGLVFFRGSARVKHFVAHVVSHM